MSKPAPWSVKGVPPETRELAKEVARRGEETLGALFTRLVRAAAAEIDDVAGRAADPAAPGRFDLPTGALAAPEAAESLAGLIKPLTAALDRVTERLDALETRAAGAPSVDRAATQPEGPATDQDERGDDQESQPRSDDDAPQAEAEAEAEWYDDVETGATGHAVETGATGHAVETGASAAGPTTSGAEDDASASASPTFSPFGGRWGDDAAVDATFRRAPGAHAAEQRAPAGPQEGEEIFNMLAAWEADRRADAEPVQSPLSVRRGPPLAPRRDAPDAPASAEAAAPPHPVAPDARRRATGPRTQVSNAVAAALEAAASGVYDVETEDLAPAGWRQVRDARRDAEAVAEPRDTRPSPARDVGERDAPQPEPQPEPEPRVDRSVRIDQAVARVAREAAARRDDCEPEPLPEWLRRRTREEPAPRVMHAPRPAPRPQHDHPAEPEPQHARRSDGDRDERRARRAPQGARPPEPEDALEVYDAEAYEDDDEATRFEADDDAEAAAIDRYDAHRDDRDAFDEDDDYEDLETLADAAFESETIDIESRPRSPFTRVLRNERPYSEAAAAPARPRPAAAERARDEEPAPRRGYVRSRRAARRLAVRRVNGDGDGGEEPRPAQRAAYPGMRPAATAAIAAVATAWALLIYMSVA